MKAEGTAAFHVLIRKAVVLVSARSGHVCFAPIPATKSRHSGRLKAEI
jgi:hypothetical protein